MTPLEPLQYMLACVVTAAIIIAFPMLLKLFVRMVRLLKDNGD